MPYPVKIYDGEGNLVRTVEPTFDPNPKQTRKFLAHPCPGCGESTSRKAYCHNCILKREKEKENPPKRGGA